jgi:hypothetical protein
MVYWLPISSPARRRERVIVVSVTGFTSFHSGWIARPRRLSPPTAMPLMVWSRPSARDAPRVGLIPAMPTRSMAALTHPGAFVFPDPDVPPGARGWSGVPPVHHIAIWAPDHWDGIHPRVWAFQYWSGL